MFRLKPSTLEGLGVLPSMTTFMDMVNRKMEATRVVSKPTQLSLFVEEPVEPSILQQACEDVGYLERMSQQVVDDKSEMIELIDNFEGFDPEGEHLELINNSIAKNIGNFQEARIYSVPTMTGIYHLASTDPIAIHSTNTVDCKEADILQSKFKISNNIKNSTLFSRRQSRPLLDFGSMMSPVIPKKINFSALTIKRQNLMQYTNTDDAAIKPTDGIPKHLKHHKSDKISFKVVRQHSKSAIDHEPSHASAIDKRMSYRHIHDTVKYSHAENRSVKYCLDHISRSRNSSIMNKKLKKTPSSNSKAVRHFTIRSDRPTLTTLD